jgi:hypothetical protein
MLANFDKYAGYKNHFSCLADCKVQFLNLTLCADILLNFPAKSTIMTVNDLYDEPNYTQELQECSVEGSKQKIKLRGRTIYGRFQ